MKLEIKEISGEATPFYVLDCEVCGQGITIRERDMKTTRPLSCSVCSHTRYLSYREYILITDRFAADLLEFAAVKFGGTRPRPFFKTFI